MATIVIDQEPYEVSEGHNLLAACLSLGFDLPYFCWHPAMGSVGACRQCAVKQFRDEQDTAGRLIMACMTPASDGTRISINDAEAQAFRARVIEWLMANHPHDCPVCDEGGECHLQDMTVMTGHNYRRYRFPKRTYHNQYLGPFIKHDMNRCIECYRCVRFYRDYAGGRDFNVFAAHNHVYFGRHEEGTLENEFSGNLVEVCPTGVFTDNTLLRHYTRKWDLQSAPSICTHCGLGCNTTPGERYGMLRRIVNRYNRHVNGYFLCDRGRFGYEFVNSPRRLGQVGLRQTRDAAVTAVEKAAALREGARHVSRRERVIGIGSPRASVEANFALRTLVGADRFCLGLSARDARLLAAIVRIVTDGPAPAATIRDVEEADAVLVLGEDLLNTAPRLALALLQSVRQESFRTAERLGIPRWHDAAVRDAAQGRNGSPLFIAGYGRTWVHDFATETIAAAPDDMARLGFAVAHALDAEAPDVPDLSEDLRRQARRIADALEAAERPVIIAGTGSLSEAVVQAAANVAAAVRYRGRPAKIGYAVPECNSLGVALMGGAALEEAARWLQDGTADTAVILENDLYERMDHPAVDALLQAARQVIVLDHLETATTARADLLFPAAASAESDGTVVNHEGRAQRFYKVFVPSSAVQESWRWLDELAEATGDRPRRWASVDDVLGAVVHALPVFGPARETAPPSTAQFVGRKVPRQPERYSGRTAMFANITVHEPPPPGDPDSPLAFSMEGHRGPIPSSLIPQFWAPRWNSNQALHKFQSEVNGPLRHEMPGVRLIEPRRQVRAYFAEIPSAFRPHPDRWWVLPVYHVFGSEALSRQAPGIAERVPAPYLVLHPQDAASRDWAERQEVTLTMGSVRHRVPLSFSPAMPRGTLGLPAMPPFTGLMLPAWGRLEATGAT